MALTNYLDQGNSHSTLMFSLWTYFILPFLLKSVNKVSRHIVLMGLIFMGAMVVSRPVLAQGQVAPANTHPKIEEDHADEAMEWLEHFINPMNEPNYYQ